MATHVWHKHLMFKPGRDAGRQLVLGEWHAALVVAGGEVRLYVDLLLAGSTPLGTPSILRKLLWFPAFGVLTSQTSGVRLQDGGTVPSDVLRELVSRAEMVICGAWDASNYLLWTPTTTSSG